MNAGRSQIWQIHIWQDICIREDAPDYQVALLAEPDTTAETIFQRALVQIEQMEHVRLAPTAISATMVNAVIKQRWTVIRGILLAREPQHRILPT